MFASGIRSELEPGVPDGMKCDAQGNVWVTAPGGVWVYAPAGELLGKVRVPELVANLAWGGAGLPHAVHDCATHSVYAVKTKVGPRLEPYMRARGGAATAHARQRDAASATATAQPAARCALDPSRCALIIQDMQNDVVMEGGAFAVLRLAGALPSSRTPSRTSRRLAERCRARGVMVIHVWFIVEPGAPGVTLNAPLFEGAGREPRRWCAAPGARRRCRASSRKPGDSRGREDAHERLGGHAASRPSCKSGRRDIVIVTGAWTNMSIEHTARTGADKGYFMVVPEDCCSTMNADWHNAVDQLRAAERLRRHQGRRRDCGARHVSHGTVFPLPLRARVPRGRDFCLGAC